MPAKYAKIPCRKRVFTRLGSTRLATRARSELVPLPQEEATNAICRDWRQHRAQQ